MKDIPTECEECDLNDDDLGTCPYENNEMWCHRISLIRECANCKKPLNKVKGAFKPGEFAMGYKLYFCCSERCAEEQQKKIDAEFGINDQDK